MTFFIGFIAEPTKEIISWLFFTVTDAWKTHFLIKVDKIRTSYNKDLHFYWCIFIRLRPVVQSVTSGVCFFHDSKVRFDFKTARVGEKNVLTDWREGKSAICEIFELNMKTTVQIPQSPTFTRKKESSHVSIKCD